MKETGGTAAERSVGTASLVVGLLATGLLFLLAVRLLGTATEAAAPQLERLMTRVVAGDASALGIGWLATYGLMNGSVVAAVAVSLFSSEVVSAAELFLLVTGSRLGSAAVVVLLGGFDFLQRRRGSFEEATGLGLLTFVLTLSIYVPATVLGYVVTAWLAPMPNRLDSVLAGTPAPFGYVEPLTGAVTGTIGPLPTLGVGMALLFGSLWAFNRLLARAETEQLRRRVFDRFHRPWVAFGVGLVVTGLTTSVAFSLGVVVPLYNRGLLRREAAIPYVLGANVGTLTDTLAVAVVLGSPGAVAVVFTVLASALVVTLVALAVYPRYQNAVVVILDRLLADRRSYVGFLLAVVLVPVALTLGGW